MTKAEFKTFVDRAIMHRDLPPDELFYANLNEVIRGAIADHEAGQWKKYPENEPEFGEVYLFQDNHEHMFSTTWYGSIAIPGAEVIAFCKKPKPYQP